MGWFAMWDTLHLQQHTRQPAPTQRLLKGDGLGIQCFAASSTAGIIAVAERGPSPRVWVYRSADLRQLTTLPARAELEYSVLDLSADGERLAVCSGRPQAALSVWDWRKVRGHGQNRDIDGGWL